MHIIITASVHRVALKYRQYLFPDLKLFLPKYDAFRDSQSYLPVGLGNIAQAAQVLKSKYL
jgi:hypothetical protein